MRLARARRGDQRVLGLVEVGRVLVLGHDQRDLGGRQTVREGLQDLGGVLGGRAAREARVEVGDEHVVGLEGLEAAGLERHALLVLEAHARRGVADAAVGVGVLVLELGRRVGRGAGLVAIALEGLLRRGIRGRGHDLLGVDAGDPLDRLAQVRGVLEVGGGRELGELQRAEDRVLALGGEQAGGDDHAAHRPGAVDLLARLGRERHSALAEAAVPARLAGAGVAALLVDAAVLGQPDHDVAPVELVAVAPFQCGESRGGRPGPGAAGVGEVSDMERHDH